VELRRARPEEYEEAGRVTALAYREFAVPGDEGWERYLAEIADVAGRAGRTLVLVAVDGERILGSVTLELERRLPGSRRPLFPGEAHMRMLGVEPGSRRRGVGRSLVSACLEEARRSGKTLLTLNTMPWMVAARKLYESMGFERARETARMLSYRFWLGRPGDPLEAPGWGD
jgi:ribosomal protein S18 acetylase RimI-like enzyme